LKITSLAILAACLVLQASARPISGAIRDAQTKQGIPYVNIGVLHKGIGTVSDENGLFSLNLENALPTDTLVFSRIGYEPRRIILEQVFRSAGTTHEWELEPKNQLLPQVEIKPDRITRKTVGNKIRKSMVVVALASKDLGAEIGTVLKHRGRHRGMLENVQFNIANCDYDSVVYRVNLYAFKKGEVGELVHNEPIIVRSREHQGIISVNVEDLKIAFDRDLLLSLEWIEGFGEELPEDKQHYSRIFFYAALFSDHSYGRTTSQADWEKLPVGVASWATARFRK